MTNMKRLWKSGKTPTRWNKTNLHLKSTERTTGSVRNVASGTRRTTATCSAVGVRNAEERIMLWSSWLMQKKIKSSWMRQSKQKSTSCKRKTTHINIRSHNDGRCRTITERLSRWKEITLNVLGVTSSPFIKITKMYVKTRIVLLIRRSRIMNEWGANHAPSATQLWILLTLSKHSMASAKSVMSRNKQRLVSTQTKEASSSKTLRKIKEPLNKLIWKDSLRSALVAARNTTRTWSTASHAITWDCIE